MKYLDPSIHVLMKFTVTEHVLNVPGTVSRVIYVSYLIL